MYARDHAPPHFHAIYGDEEAVIDIHTGEIIRGRLSRRAMRLVQDWTELHQQELLHNFEESQKPNPVFKMIEPLR